MVRFDYARVEGVGFYAEVLRFGKGVEMLRQEQEGRFRVAVSFPRCQILAFEFPSIDWAGVDRSWSGGVMTTKLLSGGERVERRTSLPLYPLRSRGLGSQSQSRAFCQGI